MAGFEVSTYGRFWVSTEAEIHGTCRGLWARCVLRRGIAMAVWKLECWSCGRRHDADFDEVGLHLRCRRCKEPTTLAYGEPRSYGEAVKFAKAQRRRAQAEAQAKGSKKKGK